MMVLRAGIVVVLVAGACDGGSSPPPPDPRQTVVDMPWAVNRDLDLLFVVDDSPGMMERQLVLAASFPRLVERLGVVPGGLPNLHVGVVTTDMGTKASGSPTPAPAIGPIGQGGCGGTGKGGELQTGMAQLTGRFLIDEAQAGGGRMGNYTGDLASAFQLMTRVGGGGCGFEQPLAAMRAALGGHPSNGGFLRPAAALGVIILADEDDCSAKSTALFGPESPALGPLASFRCTRFGVTCAQGGATPDEMNQEGAKGQCRASPSSEHVDEIEPYRDFLAELKRDERSLVVAAIAGPAEPFSVELRPPPGGGTAQPALVSSCSSMGPVGIEIANPAVRLASFLEGFPGRSASATVCQQDYSGALVEIGDLLRNALGNPCVEARLADVDPAADGQQVDCVVEETVGMITRAIESCQATSDARPCWQLEADPASCGVAPAPHWKLVVQRTEAAPPDTFIRMRCLVEP